MKTILGLAIAASMLALPGAADAAGRSTTHRHVAAKSHSHGAAHRHARPAQYARYERRSDRPYDWREPLRVERSDGRAAPTANNDYWFQSSIYDFQDGKRANIKEYRY